MKTLRTPKFGAVGAVVVSLSCLASACMHQSGSTVAAAPATPPAATTPAAAAGAPNPAALSDFYNNTCSLCHGPTGDGQSGPALHNIATFAGFLASVRAGSDNGMPPISADDYPDATAKTDYTALTGKPAN